MIRGAQSILSDKQMEMINHSAIQILQNSGMKIENETILEAMKQEGAIIDHTNKRVRIPVNMFRRLMPEHHTEIMDWQLESPGENDLAVWGSHPFILTWPELELRKAGRPDLEEALQACHSLPEVAAISPPLALFDAPPLMEPLEAVVMAMLVTDKRIGAAELFEPEQMKYAVELGEIHTGRAGATCFITACEYFTSPLMLGDRSARCILERTRLGMPTVFGSMATSGLNAPATVAGTVVLALAEILGGQIIGKCLDPTLAWSGIAATGAADMAAIGALFSTPETTLQDIALYQICRRLYGLKIGIAEHFIDATEPGIQATFEKTYRFCACASFGAHILLNNGLLCSGKAFSPVQCMLDIETDQALLRLYRGFDAKPDKLAEEIISKESLSESPNFLEQEHTFANFRSNFWFPKLLTRHDTDSNGVGRKLLDRAYGRWREAVNSYRPIDVSAEKQTAVQDVLRRARIELLNS